MKGRIILITICFIAPLLAINSCNDVLFVRQTDSMSHISEGLSLVLQNPVIRIDEQERVILIGKDSLCETLDNCYYLFSPYYSKKAISQMADSCYLEKGNAYYSIRKSISNKGFTVELSREPQMLSSLFDENTSYEALYSVVLTPKKIFKRLALKQGVIIADSPLSNRTTFYGTLPDTIISKPFVLSKGISTYYSSVEGRYYLIPNCYWRDDDNIDFEPIEILNILPSETDSLVTTINGYPVFKIDLSGIKMQVLLTKKGLSDCDGEITYSGHLLKRDKKKNPQRKGNNSFGIQ